MSVSPVSQAIQPVNLRDAQHTQGGVALQNPQLEKVQREKKQKVEPSTSAEATSNQPREADEKEQNGSVAALSKEEQRQVQALKERDREVRAHEAAHRSAGGQHVRGGVSFTYQSGPDGNRYAIGGEVSIDASPVAGDPVATLQKAEQVRRAALAPADPSPQDQAVAAQASQMASDARAQIQQQKSQEIENAAQSDDADSSQQNKNTDAVINQNVARYQAVAALESDPATEAAIEFMA